MEKLMDIRSGMVFFDGREPMTSEAFLNKLERNIETDDYNVSYNGKTKFEITYDGDDYSLKIPGLNLKNIEKAEKNTLVKRLFLLSRVEDLIKSENEQQSIEMDDETKVFYLEILKKNKKPSLKNYLVNWFKDMKESLEETVEELEFQIPLTAILGTVGGAFLMLIAIPLFRSTMAFYFLLLGLALGGVHFTVELVRNQIINRISRLKDNCKYRQISETKISILENELAMNKPLLIEDKQNIKEEGKSAPTEMRPIPSLINDLLILLERVNPINRGNLTQEIKDLVLYYKQVLGETNKSDREIFIEYPSICKKILELETKITVASKKDVKRQQEADYLLEKIDKMEQPVEEEVKIKELHL